MTLLNKSIRYFFAFAAISSVFFIIPSFASNDDASLLQSYIGTWKGLGEIARDNGDVESVKCKVDIIKSKQGRVGYKGRCAFAGGNFSIAGTMAYIAEKERFEAVMSSSTSFSGVAIGKRDGDSLVFELSDKNADTGDSFKIDSDISLIDGELSIGFTAENITTGRVIKVAIPFKM
ncbi:MAG: hypothetical protein L3J15_07445 [Devosiaceae bacterium]|nr:hypothetical protein [Devosiaceae bacterium]